MRHSIAVARRPIARGVGPVLLAGLLTSVAALTLCASTVLAQEPTYYEHVRPILVQNCMGCHSAKGNGWSMEDPEEAFSRRRKIAQAISERHMPPWLAEGGHQEYVGNPMLDNSVLEIVQRWRDGGYKKGAAKPDPVMTASAMTAHGAAHEGFVPDVSLEILPGQSYLPNASRTDDYRCFVVEWTGKEPAFITGFRAVPGNRKVAHHVVVHTVAPEMASRFKELENDEEGPGYQCFGGAVPDRLGNRATRAAYEAKYPNGVRELNRNNFWLAHWAPGMDGHVFPAGTGIPVKPGSAFVVQLHYYNKDAPGERDAGSTLDFMIASEVERPAFHMVLTNDDWLDGKGSGTMVIPAGGMATVRTSQSLQDLLGLAAYVTGVPRDGIEALEVHSANLHMHGIGHSGTVTLERAGGTPETLLRIPRWDLGWQRDFTFVTPKVFTANQFADTGLTVECTFRNPRDFTVYGGFGSDDEMCFNFSYVAVQKKNQVKAQSGRTTR
jgi:hypothetical protein